MTPITKEKTDWSAVGAAALDIECVALAAARDNIGEDFSRAVRLFLNLSGKIICMGVGKSGHIAAKAASTFSSTGTPAFFVHPTEAGHGDLGLLSEEDAVLVISYSGESGEILSLLSAFRRLKTPLVAIVGRPQSTLAGVADICLSSAVEKEACPHNLAPTASTTVALALADSLAVTLLEARGFSTDDFARCHPLGALGKRLLTCVSDIMRTGNEIPTVKADADFSEVLIEMTGKRMGMVLAADDDNRLQGIFTDGDLRRAVSGNFTKLKMSNLMKKNPQVVHPNMLAEEAVRCMKEKNINHLAVVDNGCLVGALSFHDLFRYGIL